MRAVLICSLRTLICPSSCCFNRFVSLSWFLAVSIASSMLSTSSSIASYSVFISSYRLFDSSISDAAISYFSSISRMRSRSRSSSKRNMLISYVFNSSFFFRYSLAVSACFSRGPSCFSSSARISFTLVRFIRSSSSFLSERFLRRLNLTIPAASSKSSRRSSGFPLRILSICP